MVDPRKFFKEPEDEEEYLGWDGPEWEEVVGPVDRPKAMAHLKTPSRWLRCEEQAEATNE